MSGSAWPDLESLHLWPGLDEALVEGDAMEAAQLLPDHVFLPRGRQRVSVVAAVLLARSRRDLGTGRILWRDGVWDSAPSDEVHPGS